MTSGGAAVPTESTTNAPVDPDPEPSASIDEPVDLGTFAREPSENHEVHHAAVSTEPEKRDAKMLSYEEAMALPVELGDPTTEGEERWLLASDVARIMDGHLDDMYDACIRRELERGNELGTVTIDLAIRGSDGMILGATIEPGRRRFKKCMEGYLEEVRFPRFASPRMGARYRFHTS